MAVSSIWQYREARFDIGRLSLVKGENVLVIIKPVEDVKAARGQIGRLLITNLRVIWHSQRNLSENISVGFKCFNTLESSSHRSIHFSVCESLVIKAVNRNKYEFIFSTNPILTPHMISSVNVIYKSFTASFLYRDLKVRTVLMQNGELVLLPKEEICDKINGVWNLSCDRGNLGVLYLTNIRAVWSAVTNKNFNINIPYLQMESVKIQPSKYGLALTISVSEQSGGYLMGFRVDPQEKLKEIAKEVHSLLQASNMSPNFGVTYENNKQDLVLAMEDETFGEIYSGEEDIPDPLMTYLSDGTKMDGCELEFCDHLKLAMEKLPSGITAQDLWNIPSF